MAYPYCYAQKACWVLQLPIRNYAAIVAQQEVIAPDRTESEFIPISRSLAESIFLLRDQVVVVVLILKDFECKPQYQECGMNSSRFGLQHYLIQLKKDFE